MNPTQTFGEFTNTIIHEHGSNEHIPTKYYILYTNRQQSLPILNLAHRKFAHGD